MPTKERYLEAAAYNILNYLDTSRDRRIDPEYYFPAVRAMLRHALGDEVDVTKLPMSYRNDIAIDLSTEQPASDLASILKRYEQDYEVLGEELSELKDNLRRKQEKHDDLSDRIRLLKAAINLLDVDAEETRDGTPRRFVGDR